VRVVCVPGWDGVCLKARSLVFYEMRLGIVIFFVYTLLSFCVQLGGGCRVCFVFA